MESYTRAGADLSNYRDELARGRSARTLSLRRVNRPTILGTVGGSNRQSQAKAHLSKSPSYTYFSLENTEATFSSGNECGISQFCSRLSEMSNQPKYLGQISGSGEFAEMILSAFQENFSESTKINIMNGIAAIFPNMTNTIREKLVDDGIMFTFFRCL